MKNGKKLCAFQAKEAREEKLYEIQNGYESLNIMKMGGGDAY